MSQVQRPMHSPEHIIAMIDQGLHDAGVLEEGDNILYVTDDRLRSLEDDVWHDLDESVEQGWRTQEEAEEAFLEWRSHYRGFGKAAVKDSTEPQ